MNEPRLGNICSCRRTDLLPSPTLTLNTTTLLYQNLLQTLLDTTATHDVQEEVLGMTEGLPLDTVDLAQQATRLLEEHDLTNVLNQIPADAFNDLFTEDKNGQYVPTREETEELERALEAVDKDVKSLEKLSQTQGLLETLIDDPTLVQTLAQLPEVSSLSVSGGVYANYHHNGYVVANAAVHHDVMAALPQIKNFAQHSVVDLGPSISIQTQTDTMPS
uniref:Uncharacterized protein n=1 Tax=Timema bartmani TaxID=61472 RepID=A0A7R9EM84_9NEOP|nr:unnamed protein product [Timema bartmani]